MVKRFEYFSWIQLLLPTAIRQSCDRRSIKRLICLVCMLMVLRIGVYVAKLNIDTHMTHELDSHEHQIFPCQRKPWQAKELLELLHDVHDILNEMNIRHFLMYGSIWGAFRTKGPLPWDYDIDLAIIGDERYSQIPKRKFVELFLKRGINVTDSTMYSSCYYLSRGKFAQVDIDIFYNYYGWMQRSGLLTWLLYYNYKTYHSFPAWMAEEPLPEMQFADLRMTVPRGGKTILKYLYPNDWRRPFIPAACLKEKVKDKEEVFQHNKIETGD